MRLTWIVLLEAYSNGGRRTRKMMITTLLSQKIRELSLTTFKITRRKHKLYSKFNKASCLFTKKLHS